MHRCSLDCTLVLTIVLLFWCYGTILDSYSCLLFVQDDYKDSTLLMQLLRDNFSLWTAGEQQQLAAAASAQTGAEPSE